MKPKPSNAHASARAVAKEQRIDSFPSDFRIHLTVIIELLMWTQIRKAKKQTPAFILKAPWNQRVRLSRLDLTVLGLLGTLAAYLSVFQPQVLAVGGLFSLLAISFRLLQYGIESATGFNPPIRTWHLISLVLALTIVFSQLSLPAAAQLFNLGQCISSTQICIDKSTNTYFLSIFRALILLTFGVGVIAVLRKATRGNEG